MYVSVQRAAARLGVSVVTIRRWTSSGFLPCTRTPGGHRRISTDDLDELARFIGGSDVAAAKVAREREFETVVSTAIALGSKLDWHELLAEIARQVTRILHTDYCTIYEYVPDQRLARMLADYDRHGGRWPEAGPYLLKDYPVTARVIDEQITAAVNIDDPNADPAELAALRLENDASMLLVPIVHQGESIGVVETIDHEHSRHWDRHELRMARAIATQAGTAIANARTVAEIKKSEQELTDLERHLALLGKSLASLPSAGTLESFLDGLARGVCVAFEGISCVAVAAGRTAGSTGAAGDKSGDESRDAAHVVTIRGPADRADLVVTLTLRSPLGRAATALLEFMVDSAAVHLRWLLPPTKAARE
jgi:excisionase family DNA binding protein